MELQKESMNVKKKISISGRPKVYFYNLITSEIILHSLYINWYPIKIYIIKINLCIVLLQKSVK